MRKSNLLVLAILLISNYIAPVARANPPSIYFRETGYTVQGAFFNYWQENGGLMRQGYPLSNEITEVSELDGKSYTVQYFERAVFELHPENQPPNDVQLSLLGSLRYKQKYPNAAPNQQASRDNPRSFAETGMSIGGKFRAYWERNGGLAQFGYPLTNEFAEVSDLNGQTYTVQYFERAVFELHPENAGTPYEVLLSQLGTLRWNSQHPTLPNPLAHNQFGVKASASYIVWVEQPGATATSNRIYSYSINTGQVSTVTSMARDFVDINTSTVVWEEVTADNCNGCVRAIMGANLATGQTFEVTNCASTGCFHPTVAGRTVAWREFDNHSSKLFSKNLDSGAAQQITALQISGKDVNAGPLISDGPFISDKYIVWLEMSNQSREGADYKVMAYDRISTAINTIASFNSGFNTQLALDGQRLIWTSSAGVSYVDLSSGTTQIIYTGQASYPAISGDVVVWSVDNLGDVSTQRIWGVRLSEGKAVQLTNIAGSQSQPTLGGGLLLYLQRDPQADYSHIVALPLSQAFAMQQ